ncbi:hypothetical protein [Laribacter hongkongensis]|uniref:hypothetical protein n=1 Tax=Laribacter hongkongensis TaxID=168471 RepID=UPI001EFC93AB|nr:hypothetical protein [Laribacter hongkongensis]MCG9077120.1 hypothetical protein [Laribacter hongkongensis]
MATITKHQSSSGEVSCRAQVRVKTDGTIVFGQGEPGNLGGTSWIRIKVLKNFRTRVFAGLPYIRSGSSLAGYSVPASTHDSRVYLV